MTLERGESKAQAAEVQLRKLAFEAYDDWISTHVNKHPPCPDSILDLVPFMQNRDTNDPWGTPYVIKCDPSDKGTGSGWDFHVLSAGPDGETGTADDLDSSRLKKAD